ncbi:MAG: N-acetylmuramoyl-L-alanine amidase [Nakamurella sp.]
MRTGISRAIVITAAVGTIAALTPAAFAGTPSSAATTTLSAAGSSTIDCSWASNPAVTLDDAFARSAAATSVPATVLKAVSYLESAWDNHEGLPSADGGYGPMNLTDRPASADNGKGDGSSKTAQSVQTAVLGAKLTGQSLAAVKGNANANVCAGAAVLASYYGGHGSAAATTKADVNGWTTAIARFGAAGSGQSSQEFAARVLTVLHSGASRVTANGQRVALAAQPTAKVPAPAAKVKTDCPASLNCDWIPAPYLKLDPADPDNTGNYGNHDLADRTGAGGPKLSYIVIHDTEGTYQSALNLVQDPSYLAWNYTIRSSDGQVAQHLDAKDVGWHAGNWYVNMHAIGIEHEGYGGSAGWYTEAMYESSATLVKYLAHKYDIPLDPEHIIGHDQVPGILPGYTTSMHWDPGPYWDWEHYFDLLGAPIGGKKAAPTTSVSVGDVVTVKPGYAGNTHTITQCHQQSPGSPDCVSGTPTNFAALFQSPSLTGTLAKDVGTHPTGSADGTTSVNDVSARAQAGNKLVVAAVSGEWVKVSWAGEFVWVDDPVSHPVLVKTPTATVSVKAGATSAPVYGRAYPEQAAYPSTVAYQTVTPLEYTLKAGQSYAITDRSVVTDYYNAKTYDGSTPGDRTDVKGADVYYQVALAHRILYVRAADVQVTEVPMLVAATLPTIDGTPRVGKTLTALTGQWTGGVKTFTFQWLRDGHRIAGATGQAYSIRKVDATHKLSVRVTGSAPNATDVSATSKAVKAKK